MRILLSNINLDTPHGSEVWCWTVARELIKRDHRVFVYSRKYGMMAQKLSEAGCTLLSQQSTGRKFYDIGIINHGNVIGDEIKKNAMLDRAVLMTHSKIQKVHGKLQAETPPIEWECGDYKHVAISREVADFWNDRIGKNFQIIPNPVSPEFFNIPTANEKTPKVILWGNHRFRVPALLKTIAQSRGYAILHGLNNSAPELITENFKACRIICGTGRWIYEGMAAGRNCVVMNDNRMLGMMAGAYFDSWQAHNMTMRHPYSKPLDAKSLGKAIDSFAEGRGLVMKAVANESLHVSKVVDKLLEF